jgi:hypothetical protein
MASQQPSCNRLSGKFPRGTLFTNYILGWSPQVAAQRTIPKKLLHRRQHPIQKNPDRHLPTSRDVLAGLSEAENPEIAVLLRA